MLIKKNQIAAQLYSFRDFIKTKAGVREVFHKLHKMGYRGVQLSSSIAAMPEEELKELLAESELIACSSHEGVDDILNNTEKVIGHLKKVGCDHLAIPCPILMTGEYEVKDFAYRLNNLAKQFADEGIVFSYHNHAIEFLKFNGKTVLETIYENAPALEAELDTHWVHRGGGDVVQWIRKFENRMRVLHLKDYGMATNNRSQVWAPAPVMAPIGEGNLDWKNILSAAKAVGVKWYVVEHDGDCPDPFESFETSIRYLTTL